MGDTPGVEVLSVDDGEDSSLDGDESWDGDEALVAGAPLRFIETKARSAKRQARDDVGRWRKIYYRLRRTRGSEAKIRAAYLLVKDAELRAEMRIVEPGAKKTEAVRKNLAANKLSQDVDERVASTLMKSAMDAARLSRRLEALGPDTLVNFSALPQDIQDAIKKYMRRRGLEPRITKHFEPFLQGKIQRSVKDVLNLVDRTVIDNQVYKKGYDREKGG